MRTDTVDDHQPKWDPPRRADVIDKYIADGGNWQNPDEYRKLLGRLIRDLRSETEPTP